MKNHHVRVHRSEENLERKDQLAWKLAEVAVDDVEVLRVPTAPDEKPGHPAVVARKAAATGVDAAYSEFELQSRPDDDGAGYLPGEEDAGE